MILSSTINRCGYSTEIRRKSKDLPSLHYRIVSTQVSKYSSEYIVTDLSQEFCHICEHTDTDKALTLMCMAISEKSLSEDWNSVEDDCWNNL